jgi:hypothetical protein
VCTVEKQTYSGTRRRKIERTEIPFRQPLTVPETPDEQTKKNKTGSYLQSTVCREKWKWE